ncbi:MAG: hypothetical protein Kow0022_04350 [Phycisphaerales bacterium]
MNRPRSTQLWHLDLLAGLALLGVCGATLFFGILPLIQANTAKAELTLELRMLEKKIALQNAATAGYADALSLIDERLSDDPVELGERQRVSEVLAWVAQEAESHELVIDALIPKPVESHAPFARLPIEMRGRGSYPDVADFLHQIRQRDGAIAVRALELRADDPTRLPAFSIELVWFVQPVPADK